MGAWIFQGNPDRYDVADPEVFYENQTEIWHVTRYRDEMQVGDIVYFWRSGEEKGRGIYGWGQITSGPEYHDGWGWGIPVFYKKRFRTHLRASDVRNDPFFKDHLLFTVHTGTNFSLNDKQVDALKKLVCVNIGEEYAPEVKK